MGLPGGYGEVLGNSGELGRGFGGGGGGEGGVLGNSGAFRGSSWEFWLVPGGVRWVPRELLRIGLGGMGFAGFRLYFRSVCTSGKYHPYIQQLRTFQEHLRLKSSKYLRTFIFSPKIKRSCIKWRIY